MPMKAIAKRLFDPSKRLNSHEMWLALQITCLLSVLPLLKRVLTLTALVRILDTRQASQAPSANERRRIIWLTQGLLNQNIGFLKPNCFTQSLVLFHFLRKNGYPVRIHLGIKKDGADLHGHSWLDFAGRPIAEETDPNECFKVVYSFP